MQLKYLLSFVLFIMLQHTAESQVNHSPSKREITLYWEFRQAHKGDWKPIEVPSSVHTALLQHKMIEEPYYRDNEEKLQWIENEDWEYRTTFNTDEGTLQKKHVEMVFTGLDTYAQIFLNDSLILETDNMFREWRVDIKPFLKLEGNQLHIYFESPVKKSKADWDALGYELPGGQRTMTRKAQFHYGWDWGPRFVGAGILKRPYIEAWDELRFENVHFTTISLTPEKARVVARYRYNASKTMDADVVVRYGKIKSIDKRLFASGIHEDSVWFDVENPKLWWCRDMGESYLYDFTLEVKRSGGELIERKDMRVGLRTIELVTEKDAAGETFFFRLNGKPVFAKGANYIPQDMFQDRVTGQKYRKIIDDVVASNMNMLRVWGGGIYEDDTFYQLCDAKGILVWQDFMYACALYPGGNTLRNKAKEALYQIERLRNHPCMALWCGNNENDEAWNNWGWQMKFTEAQRTQLWRDYKTLFNDVLGTYVKNFAEIPYWESSPRYGRANPKSLTEGDSHYWGVWHDEEPFSIYDKKVPRFMSEYGFQSFPEWRTIQSFTLPEDRELESKVMLLHQKHPRGNALIAEYTKRDFNKPKNFEDFVYVSQLVQAEGMRRAIEAHRRNKPYCMGTLYWQLNDVWPVASWSSIDCFGRWKAMQYYVREAFSPVAALPFMVDNNILSIYGVNDFANDTTVTIRVHARNFEGKTLSDVTRQDVAIPSDSSRVIWQGDMRTVLDKNKPESSVVEILLMDAKGKVLYRRLFYPVAPKQMRLSRANVKTVVEQVKEGYMITLETNTLAKNVLIQTEADGFFIDNYFDLMPGEKKQVLFKTERILDTPSAAFSVKSL